MTAQVFNLSEIRRLERIAADGCDCRTCRATWCEPLGPAAKEWLESFISPLEAAIRERDQK